MIEIQWYTNGVLKNLLRNAFACMGVETNKDICFFWGLFACSLYYITDIEVNLMQVEMKT